MALTPKQEKSSYLNVLSSDGSLRMVVDQDTPGAERRDWVSGDGKTSGVKYELVYQDVSGIITSVEMYEGDYGKNLIIGLTDGDEPEVKVSMSMNSPFGEEMAKKLPSIDMTKTVKIAPYAFEDEKGKTRKGVSVVQDEKKLQNFFYDFNAKENINGYPSPALKKDKKTGEDKPFSKDEWKIYFGIARQFLVDYIEEHHLKKSNNILDEEAKNRAKLDEFFPEDKDIDVKF